VARNPSAIAGLAGDASGRPGPDLAEPGQIRPAHPFSFSFSLFKSNTDYVLYFKSV
jgi:hypothetical protein